MSQYLQILIYGVTNGAYYSLVALGLSLVYGVMRYLNVAHGALIMLAAYSVYWVFRYLKVDPFLSTVLVFPCLFGLGLVLYQLLYKRLSRLTDKEKLRNSLLVSFGLLLILSNLAILFWTADERAVTTSYTGSSLAFFDLRLPYPGLGALLLAAVVILGLGLFLNKTYFGKAIKAVSQDIEAAGMVGINEQRTYLVSFALGVALATMPGVIVSLATFNPGIAFDLTTKALVVIVLGGVGSINGVLLGGIALGLAEAVTVLFVSASYREVIGLVLFVLFLIFRPSGLLGRRL